MVLRVSSAALRCVIVAAADSPSAEICGLLWGAEDRVAAAQITPNIALDRARAFEIDPASLIAAHRRARRLRHLSLIGHFHSHPSGDAMPSQRDAAAAMGNGALWMIAAQGIVRLWRAVEHGNLHDRFDLVAFAIGRDTCVDKVGTGVRMHPGGPDGEPPLLESIA